MNTLRFFAAPDEAPKPLRRHAFIYLMAGLLGFVAVATWVVVYLALLLTQQSLLFTTLIGALASAVSLTCLVVGWALLHGAPWSALFLPVHVRTSEEVRTYLRGDAQCPGCGVTFVMDAQFCTTCGHARNPAKPPVLTQLTFVVKRLVVPQRVEPARTQSYLRREPVATTHRLFYAAIGIAVVGWILAQVVSTGGLMGSLSGFRNIGLLLAVIVPPVVLTFWIRAQDHFEPEPLGLVLMAFSWGALTHVWVHHLQMLLWYPVVAGMVEELPKALIVYFLATHRLFRKEFNGPVDGLVYGAAAGLGFESIANFQLLLMTEDPIRTFLLSGAVPFSHMVWTGITGSWIGLMMLRRGQVTLVDLAIAAIPAMILHGLFDLFLYLPMPETLWLFFFVGIVLASAFFFFKLLAEGLRDEAAWGYPTKAPVESFT